MQSIGTIHTDYKSLENMPIQSKAATDSLGKVILLSEYQAGLIHLDGFSHIYLVYRFHLSNGYELSVKPFLDVHRHGLFATRAPRRPNPIGISIVRIRSVYDNIIEFAGADMIDGTPLLDIKPYIKQFDMITDSTSGWVEAAEETIRCTRSDNRFIDSQ